MRYILLIYQNTEAWNGLSQEDKDVFMHGDPRAGGHSSASSARSKSRCSSTSAPSHTRAAGLTWSTACSRRSSPSTSS